MNTSKDISKVDGCCQKMITFTSEIQWSRQLGRVLSAGLLPAGVEERGPTTKAPAIDTRQDFANHAPILAFEHLLIGAHDACDVCSTPTLGDASQ
jgi:hypothetical protein